MPDYYNLNLNENNLKVGMNSPTQSCKNGSVVNKRIKDEIDLEFSEDTKTELAQFNSDPMLSYSEPEFKAAFRVSQTSFKCLLDFLLKEEMELIENVPLYKKLLIVLWMMSNSGSFSSAAQVFGLGEETVANCFLDICATLYNNSDYFISWPSFEESAEISRRIEDNYAFSGVVGVLGCSYFPINIPKDPVLRKDHFNGQLRAYSIALQVVCDDNLMIRDVFPGLPGGIPEAQVLKKSPLCEQLTSSNLQPLIEPNKHLLAREFYPQLKSMLTPYSEVSGSLEREEREFNELHENVCQLVDQTFDMLRERFLILKMLDMDVSTMVLVVACIIHNVCLQNGDVF